MIAQNTTKKTQMTKAKRNYKNKKHNRIYDRSKTKHMCQVKECKWPKLTY